jgi:hypothetical protein
MPASALRDDRRPTNTPGPCWVAVGCIAAASAPTASVAWVPTHRPLKGACGERHPLLPQGMLPGGVTALAGAHRKAGPAPVCLQLPNLPRHAPLPATTSQSSREDGTRTTALPHVEWITRPAPASPLAGRPVSGAPPWSAPPGCCGGATRRRGWGRASTRCAAPAGHRPHHPHPQPRATGRHLRLPPWSARGRQRPLLAPGVGALPGDAPGVPPAGEPGGDEPADGPLCPDVGGAQPPRRAGEPFDGSQLGPSCCPCSLARAFAIPVVSCRAVTHSPGAICWRHTLGEESLERGRRIVSSSPSGQPYALWYRLPVRRESALRGAWRRRSAAGVLLARSGG